MRLMIYISIVYAVVCVACAEAQECSWASICDEIGLLRTYVDVSNAAVQIAACGRDVPLMVRRRMAQTLLASVTPAQQGAGETYAAALLAGQLLDVDARPEERAQMALTRVRALVWHGLTVEATQLLDQLAREELPPAVSGQWLAAKGLCMLHDEQFDDADRLLARACAGREPAWEEALRARARLAARAGRYDEAFELAEHAARRWGMGCPSIHNNLALRMCGSLASAPPAPRIAPLWRLLDDLRTSMPRTAAFEDAIVFLHVQDRFLRRLYPELLGHLKEPSLP